jgi:nicotinate-nucleotide pyrophosphorylase (carboxylating)
MTDQLNLNNIIENALQEDLGEGDHTSLAIFPHDLTGKAKLIIKDNGILAGIPVAERIFQKIDKELSLTIYKKDGDMVMAGDIAFEVRGKVISILSAERVALNFMQRLSGIATMTHYFSYAIRDLKTRILDTRKTTPNLRELEKYAVRIGGGMNHRMGLYDMIMIKDNHVDYAGSVERAIGSVNKYLISIGKKMKIVIEVRNFDELVRALNFGKIDRVLMDNFSVNDLRQAVKIVNGLVETEASGGIGLENVRDYAETGVDFISVGYITHHIHSLDMSLKASRKSFLGDDI